MIERLTKTMRRVRPVSRVPCRGRTLHLCGHDALESACSCGRDYDYALAEPGPFIALVAGRRFMASRRARVKRPPPRAEPATRSGPRSIPEGSANDRRGSLPYGTMLLRRMYRSPAAHTSRQREAIGASAMRSSRRWPVAGPNGRARTTNDAHFARPGRYAHPRDDRA
jgi:hypothetical protein